MKHTWVVVANSTFARIFSAENNKDLKEVALLEHPESRLHGRDLVSDRPGRGYESANPSRHAMEPKHSPQKLEFQIFAKHISDHLEQARKEGRFDNLYIAANPSFLGILRQTISKTTAAKALAGEIDKDMTQLLPNEIRNHLPLVL